MLRQFAVYVVLHFVVLWVATEQLVEALLHFDPVVLALIVLILLSAVMFLTVQIRNVNR